MTTESTEKREIREVTTGRFLPGHNIGRPRKSETYAELAAALPVELKRTHIMAMSDKAADGDVRAFEALRDTAEGRPQQRVEVHDTSVDNEVFDKVLQALAAANAITLPDVVDAEFREISENTSP